MILVDAVRRVDRSKNYPWTTTCHMVSDHSIKELRRAARFLGLSQDWLQDGRHPHFDITYAKRRMLIDYRGAHGLVIEEVTTRDIISRMVRL